MEPILNDNENKILQNVVEEQYDVKIGRVPLGLSGHKIVCDWTGDGLYLVGGWTPEYESEPEDSDRHYYRHVWKYNLSTKTWKQCRSLNPPVSLASHCLTKLDDTKNLLLYGGSMSARNIVGNSNETFLYNVHEETWNPLTTTGDKCAVECGHWFGQAIHKADDGLFVCTGFMETGVPSALKVHKLNLQNLHWEDLSSIDQQPVGRVRHEITIFNDMLYVFGGGERFRSSVFSLNTLPCLDTRSKSWSTVNTVPDSEHGYPKGRLGHSLVTQDENVYVAAGFGFTDPDEFEYELFDDVWRFHLPTLTWKLLPYKLPVSVWFHAADITQDGRMYVFGGCVDDYSTRINRMFKIRTSTEVPSLESFCWDKVLNSSKHNSVGLHSYSDEYLNNVVGLTKKYICKLRL